MAALTSVVREAGDVVAELAADLLAEVALGLDHGDAVQSSRPVSWSRQSEVVVDPASTHLTASMTTAGLLVGLGAHLAPSRRAVSKSSLTAV
ncbi:MAG: hypothetical protein J7D61_17035 [Marichromatium sp.]|nr:hypothetical protein [Marichromatium sp.]